MRIIFFILVCLFALAPITLLSQATDNSGKDLFVTKNTSNFKFPITSTGFSIEYTSSMNAKDTVKIRKLKYDRLRPIDSTNFYFDKKTKSYFRIIHRRNNLHSYYFISVLAEYIYDNIHILNTLPTKITAQLYTKKIDSLMLLREKEETISQLIDILKSKDLPSSANRLGDDIVAYLEGIGTSPDEIYHVTDVGTGINPWFMNLKLSNLSLKPISNFFSSSNQPSLQLEIGAISNSVVKFKNWDNLKIAIPPGWLGKILRFHEYDLFYSLFLNSSFINYYDTINHMRTPTDIKSISKFTQFGGKLNATAYWSKALAGSITASLYYGLPLDNDKNYQTKKSRTVSAIDTGFYALGQSAGKYGGGINAPGWNGRISVAFPVFLNFINLRQSDASKKGTSSLYLLPSYAPFGSWATQWTHQIGLSLNLLSSPYGGKNSSILQAGGIGADLLTGNTHTGWGSPIVYVSGSINLGAITKQKGHPESIH
jgi:hypothetical protein